MSKATLSTATIGTIGTGITLAQVNTVLGTLAGLLTCSILAVRLWNLIRKGREENKEP